jgi:uncharacterized protein YndB with AHSA1/START domain
MDHYTLQGKTQHGYLVLADISGYTSYLAGVELDHAHEILTDLLETIIKHFRGMLTIAKLEGDAVFAYAPETRLPRGETLLELIECTYVAFRDRVEAAHRRTTCECKACRSIPALDLKFFAHHGDYIVQDVSGIRELVGSDVNLIHRLTKNHVTEATGWRAYALFTERGLDHMGVRPEGLHGVAETYEHLGEVKTLSLDLHPRYQALKEARRAYVTVEAAHATLTTDAPVPPAMVWEWLNDPHKIARWSPDRHMVPGVRPGGRTGVGARNHCVHGQKEVMLETVLDWHPFDYLTVRTNNHGMPVDFMITYILEPTPAGTRVSSRWLFLPKGPLPAGLARWLGGLMLPMFGMPREMAALGRLLAAEAAEAAPPAALAHLSLGAGGARPG